ncbi:alpha/beta hydrolase fold [Nocardioides terrae]|uniref:Alpha/beta hydrolase fold n=1 Tax=Nocardioides terrae TaxID=574651 RepID=A0A1I1H1M4_9ACTN|nr:alpha/beta fold hydrolase [Nocardioides terrae]SFC17947.1 alpha/beta hydrolase fold [Nocardioides terrae]
MSRIVAAVVVLALVLGGGGLVALTLLRSDDDGSTSAPLPSPAAASIEPGAQDAPDPALQSFYTQTLDWSRCRSRFWCSTLEVPLDYAQPSGQTIRLALLEAPATGKRIGSMVVNPGGPGVPGTDYAAVSSRAFREPLRQRYDIVGFDPRGTGASSPVDCLGDSALTAFLSADPDPDDSKEESAFFDSARAMGAGCAQRSGAVAAHVSTVEAARDIDVLRAALGEAKLTYWGASYGTKLGATYADLFPTRVGRFVLDGALDPALPTREINLQQAKGFETALRAYVENCTKSSGCFLGHTVDEGVAKIKSFLDDVDAEPLPSSDGRQVTEGDAFIGLAYPLYSRDLWLILSTALKAALAGDGSGLMVLADAYAERSKGEYANNSQEAIYAINCLDDPWALHTPAEVKAEVPAFEEASPTFGRAFAWMGASCSGFQQATTSKPHPVRAAGAAPIVVTGTTRDPATPLQWAENLAAELESGVLVTRDGDGHTAYNSGNKCVDNALEDYMIDGKVPKDGLAC